MSRNKGSKNTIERIKSAIIQTKANNPGYSATEILRHLGKPESLKYWKITKKDLPAPRTINDTIKKNRPAIKQYQSDVLNKYWTMGALIDNDLPASTIPHLLKIQEERRTEGQTLLTIREALWVGRLSEVVKITNRLPVHKVLNYWASSYAFEERQAVLKNIPLDTSDYDRIITTNPEEYASAPFLWYGIHRIKGIEDTLELLRGWVLFNEKPLTDSTEELEIILKQKEVFLKLWDLVLAEVRSRESEYLEGNTNAGGQP